MDDSSRCVAVTSSQPVETPFMMARSLIGTVTLSICCERKMDISESSEPWCSESFFIFFTIENSTTCERECGEREVKQAVDARADGQGMLQRAEHAHGYGSCTRTEDVTDASDA